MTPNQTQTTANTSAPIDLHLVQPFWNELSLRQLLTIFQILTCRRPLIVDTVAMDQARRIRVFEVLHPQLPKDWLELFEDPEDDDEDLILKSTLNHALDHSLGRLFIPHETQAERYRLTLELTRCPYPKLVYDRPVRKGKPAEKATFYAPADALRNITIYELSVIFSDLEEYIRSNDETRLTSCLAVIYRAPKPKSTYNLESAYEGDIRLPYRKYEGTVARREPHMQQLTPIVRQLLAFWLASCRALIISRYKKAFERPEDSSPWALGGERVGNDYSWGGVLLSLAGGPAQLEAVADQHYGNALTYLCMLEDQREALQQK